MFELMTKENEQGKGGKSSPASPLRRSEGGSRLRNPGLAPRFASIRLYVCVPVPGAQFGPGEELLFYCFTPARTSDLLYKEVTFPIWSGSADHRQ